MNPTMVGDPSVSLTAAPAFSGNTGTLRFLNYSPYALAVSLRRGTFVVPPYCPRDLRVDVYENIQWTLQYQLAGVSKNPASYLVIEAYDEGEDIPQLPPSFSCPLVNIGNTTPVATSAQQVDATFSTSTTTPQVMTATAGTGLGVEDQKASGYIELYPTATDGTARGIALGYIDSGGTLHVGANLDNVGNFRPGLDVIVAPTTIPAAFFNATIPSTVTDINGVFDIVDNTSGGIHYQIGKLAHANGDTLRIIDVTNGKALLGILPNAVGITIGGAVVSIAGQGTAGSFGVPVVVASTKDLAVTSSTGVNVISFTTANDGNNHRYRVGANVWVGAGNTNNGTITVQLTWSDAFQGTVIQDLNTQSAGFGVLSGFTITKGAATVCIPFEIEAKPNTSIALAYQNGAAGTISDHVSGCLEILV